MEHLQSVTGVISGKREGEGVEIEIIEKCMQGGHESSNDIAMQRLVGLRVI